MMMIEGHLSKMKVALEEPVQYQLALDETKVALNPWIGKEIRLEFAGVIHCIACGRKTKKSYNQGYCFPCTQKLAACDLCIVRPELCHYDEGTCREPDWADGHCMAPHYVYLANSSCIKVGITREGQIPTRWIDQGATQALPIFRVGSRYISGLLEVVFKSKVNDRTDWRKMLKGEGEPVDLEARCEELLDTLSGEIEPIRERFGAEAVQVLRGSRPTSISYPVEVHPKKIASLNFDKTPSIKSRLFGIKGQYLLLEAGVLNIRKFTGYQVAFEG